MPKLSLDCNRRNGIRNGRVKDMTMMVIMMTIRCSWVKLWAIISVGQRVVDTMRRIDSVIEEAVDNEVNQNPRDGVKWNKVLRRRRGGGIDQRDRTSLGVRS